MTKKDFIVCVELSRITELHMFESALSSFGEYKQLMEGVYVLTVDGLDIKSSLLVSEINKRLFSEARIFIMRSSLDTAWLMDLEMDGWLRSNL